MPGLLSALGFLKFVIQELGPRLFLPMAMLLLWGFVLYVVVDEIVHLCRKDRD
jgi:hypothetical protein